MRKTIYVTVAEFEENGGVLENGRQIFNAGTQAFYKFNKDYEDDYQIWVTNGAAIGGTVQKDTAQVAIECEPFYV